MFTSITGSVLGAVLYWLCVRGIGIFTPDFPKEFFFHALADQQHGKKFFQHKVNLINLVIFDLVFFPIVSYFLIIPLATQTKTLARLHTLFDSNVDRYLPHFDSRCFI